MFSIGWQLVAHDAGWWRQNISSQSVETDWLALLHGDALSPVTHPLMWMTVHQFEVTSSLETLKWQSGGRWRSTTIKILDAHWLWHHQTWAKQKKSHLLFSFLVRIVLFLHFIGRIYLSKTLLHNFFGVIWIITPLINLYNYTPYNYYTPSIQETKIIAWCLSRA